jgi:hypothetical protein
MPKRLQILTFGAIGLALMSAFIIGGSFIGVRFGLAWMLIVSALLGASIIIPVFIRVFRSFRSLNSMTRMAGRAQRNECIGCGYSLRTTPLRCPECGVEQSEANRLKVFREAKQ